MIKNLLYLILVGSIATSAAAQTAAPPIPPQVLQSFQAVYPAATGVTWTREWGYFAPAFTLNGKQITGYLDLKGAFIQTVVRITPAELPAAAMSYIKDKYTGSIPSEAGKIDFNTNQAPRYYAIVKGKQLLFDNQGTFIKITSNPLKQ